MRDDNGSPPVDVDQLAGDHAAALTSEKAVTSAAIAAAGWCSRASGSPARGDELLMQLMDASAWATRHRRMHGAPALSLAEFTDALSRPLDEWLPGAGDFLLIDAREPTPICLELRDAAGASALEEVEQRVIKQAMMNLASRPEGAATYTEFRRFLVENAHAPRDAAARAVRKVGLDLGSVYGPPAETVRFATPAGDVLYPCPRCRWPMTVRESGVSCARSLSCLAAGARFAVRDGVLLPLGRLSAPSSVSFSESASLLPGIWRYTVLPGIEELALAERLRALQGVSVELWPYIDAYDLDVRRGESHWRIDVKDHASSVGLARYLAEHPARDHTWIVVPDYRRAQVPILRRLAASDVKFRFASSSEIVRNVKGDA